MSKFFKALEQAERERALREHARRQEPEAVPATPIVPAASREAPAPGRVPVTAKPPAAPSDGVEEHLVSLLAPTSSEAEQYRALRHMVEQLHRTADLSVVAVSSPAAGDGKTLTAINLAGALAQAPEARVLLVDADLRLSATGDRLGLGNIGTRSLVNAILSPGLALEDVVRPCPPFNLSVLPAGRRLAAPYELLKSERLGELLGEARRHYNYIVLDTPPLVPFPDCRVIGKWVDGFLVVVAAHKTPRKLVEEALSVMDPAKVVGLVFNNDDHALLGYYYYPERPSDGDRAGWWDRAVKRLRGSPPSRPSSRTDGGR